jgi:hypothetical protein
MQVRKTRNIIQNSHHKFKGYQPEEADKFLLYVSQPKFHITTGHMWLEKHDTSKIIAS